MTTANNDERRGECAPAISIFCLHSREPEIYQNIAARDMDEMGRNIRDDDDVGDDKNNITQKKNDSHTEIRVSLLAWLKLFCILYDEYKIYRMAHGSWKILQNLMEEWICVYSEKLVSN